MQQAQVVPEVQVAMAPVRPAQPEDSLLQVAMAPVGEPGAHLLD